MELAGSVDLVLLDLDGTVDRSGRGFRDCLRHVRWQARSGPDTTRWLMRVDGEGYAPRTEVAAALFDRFPHLLDAHSGCVDKLLDGGGAEFVTLDEQVKNALVAQRERGRALVVVTNGPTEQQEEKLARSGLTGLVDAWAVSESLGLRKPDPEIFRVAAAMVGMGAQGAWRIGDSATADVGGGAAAGCRTVWISRGRPWPEVQPEPSFLAIDLVTGLEVIG